jgi:hypothetical protein
MKNIPPSSLPHFSWLRSEDMNAFRFEFGVLFHGYNYSSDFQKINLFPTSLKDVALHWFMGLVLEYSPILSGGVNQY